MKQGRAKVVERIAQNMTSDEFSQLVRQYERLVYTKDYLKSAYHRRVSAAEDGEMPAVADVLNTMPPPEDITIAKDEAARIRDTILALKEPYHQVAVLFFLEEKSVDEIASALRRPPKTVHTQIYRAKQLLQNAIERGNGHGIVQ